MSRLIRTISLIWLVPLVVLVLGCRTIGSDPWRSAELQPRSQPALEQATSYTFVCTSDTESKYTVDGAYYSYATTTVTRTIMAQEIGREWLPDSSLPRPSAGPMTSSSWAPDAKLRLETLVSSEGVDQRLLERALRSQKLEIEACYEQRVGQFERQRVRVRLRFGASGELLAIEFQATGLAFLARSEEGVCRAHSTDERQSQERQELASIHQNHCGEVLGRSPFGSPGRALTWRACEPDRSRAC